MYLNKLLTISIILMLSFTSCMMKEIQEPPPIVEPPTPPPPKTAKIALVLGAGSSKGFAHIGVLKILETNKIPIHMIVGTSVGSAVGSLYAYGLSSFDLQRLSFTVEQKDIVDLTFPENGFIKGEKLEEFINKTLRNTPMERLKITFYAVAAEIQSGEETVFGRGNTGQAVRASCAIPGVFRPVKIGEKMYVDGGVVSPIAVEAARRLGADVVIAVDITASGGRSLPENTVETILHSINIMYSKLSAIQVTKADVVIRPKVGHIGSADFSKKHEAILEGEKATIEVMPRILEILTQLRLEERLE